MGIALTALPSCAWEVVYGPFFIIRGITRERQRIVLPLSRKKYANVRVLDEKTYRWLQACQTERCHQPQAQGQTEVVSVRAAQTRQGMWIAEVAIDQRWLITLLVFQNPTGYGIVSPEVMEITQADWYRQVQQQVNLAVDDWKKEHLTNAM